MTVTIWLLVFLAGLLVPALGAMLDASDEAHQKQGPLKDPSLYGTTREYGFTHDNAKRSWLKRHYGVPYEKHGALYLEPSPVKQYLGLARETRPGDDSYDGTPGSMTVELLIPR